jgi:hypothetical protein
MSDKQVSPYLLAETDIIILLVRRIKGPEILRGNLPL